MFIINQTPTDIFNPLFPTYFSHALWKEYFQLPYLSVMP